MQITKRVEFDYGHRVPSHRSKCRNIHGHRGVLEVTLDGPIQLIRGESDDGMVIDFADIKSSAIEIIAEPWDHAFICYSEDHVMRDFLRTLPDHKTVVVPFIPTAENLVQYAFDLLSAAYMVQFGDKLRLVRVRLYETPNSWADATEVVF